MATKLTDGRQQKRLLSLCLHVSTSTSIWREPKFDVSGYNKLDRLEWGKTCTIKHDHIVLELSKNIASTWCACVNLASAGSNCYVPQLETLQTVKEHSECEREREREKFNFKRSFPLALLNYTFSFPSSSSSSLSNSKCYLEAASLKNYHSILFYSMEWVLVG